MTPTELARSIPFGPHPPKDIHIYVSIALCYLSEHFYEAQTESGMRVSDPLDVKRWLAEMAAALNLNGELSRKAESTKVPSLTETRTGLRVTGRVPQLSHGEFCPDCGHIHLDDDECSFPIGGARKCRCERKVSA